MKNIRQTLAMSVIAATVLAACGGGGDDQAGSVTAFSVQPTEVTVTGDAGECSTGTSAAGATARIFVYGGTAPYRIDNPFPTHIALDRTRVDNRGDYFTVTFLGGCVNPATLIIVDAVDKQVSLTLINEEGD